VEDHARVDASMAVAGPARRFVGRTGERTLLRHLLRDAAEGRPAIVVVSGVPGAGKSALLEWASDEAARLGARVLRASCYESSLPFAAVGRLVAPFRLTAGQRAAMHRSTAERLRAHHAARGPIDDEAQVRIADHLLRAGPDVPPGEVEDAALHAGRIAMRWTAYDQAARFLAAAAGAARAGAGPGRWPRP
jgi:hypothetical protein